MNAEEIKHAWLKHRIEGVPMNEWVLDIPTEDVVCTGGSSSTRCMNPVSADDPDDELCHECLEKHVLKLEENLMDAIEQLMRYRRAVK